MLSKFSPFNCWVFLLIFVSCSGDQGSGGNVPHQSEHDPLKQGPGVKQKPKQTGSPSVQQEPQQEPEQELNGIQYDSFFGTPQVDTQNGVKIVFTPSTKDKKSLTFIEFVDEWERMANQEPNKVITFIRNIGKLSDQYGLNDQGFEFRADDFGNGRFQIILSASRASFHQDPLNGPLIQKSVTNQSLVNKIKDPKNQDNEGLTAAFDSRRKNRLIWPTKQYATIYDFAFNASNPEILAWVKRIIKEIRWMKKIDRPLNTLGIHCGSLYAQVEFWLHFRLQTT